MSYIRITKPEQIASIKVGDSLLQYPKVVYMPDKLSYDKTGKIHMVSKVEGDQITIMVQPLNGYEIQAHLENLNPVPKPTNDFLNEKNWFIKIVD